LARRVRLPQVGAKPNGSLDSPRKIADEMQEEDIQTLRAAIAALEHPGFAARLAEIAGKPIELFNRTLPEPASKAIAVATTQALGTALRVALRTMQNEPKAASSYLHKAPAGLAFPHWCSLGRLRPPFCLTTAPIIHNRPDCRH
jgi:hypothetical protein